LKEIRICEVIPQVPTAYCNVDHDGEPSASLINLNQAELMIHVYEVYEDAGEDLACPRCPDPRIEIAATQLSASGPDENNSSLDDISSLTDLQDAKVSQNRTLCSAAATNEFFLNPSSSPNSSPCSTKPPDKYPDKTREFPVYEFEQRSESNSTSDEIETLQYTRLPASKFEGLWEALILEPTNLAENTLYQIQSGFEMSFLNINPVVAPPPRITLFHGPPGTGKSTLCRAIAQKLAIRIGEGKLCWYSELNSNAIMSKYFGESPKALLRTFRTLRKVARSSHLLVVTVDEIESLALNRSGSESDGKTVQGDPGDALRAVNSLLTQLDMLRMNHANVFILATSNLVNQIDIAFMDRVDLVVPIEIPRCKGMVQTWGKFRLVHAHHN
jgi:hypothetical protein